jgi:hypothetical protein
MSVATVGRLRSLPWQALDKAKALTEGEKNPIATATAVNFTKNKFFFFIIDPFIYLPLSTEIFDAPLGAAKIKSLSEIFALRFHFIAVSLLGFPSAVLSIMTKCFTNGLSPRSIQICTILFLLAKAT